MIYIDTNPGMTTDRTIKNAFSTLVHEMQHLINYVTSVLQRSTMIGNQLYTNYLDLWIDEGLAVSAEWIYSGTQEDRIRWYNTNGIINEVERGLINKGNNFFVWNNRTGESDYAVMDDYATVYLFFQWLRIHHADEEKIYRDILMSSKSNHEAVVEAMSGYSNWGDLFRDWLVANGILASTGIYGYNGKIPTLTKKWFFPGIGTTAQLFPGEAVYRNPGTSPVISGQGTNIRNSYLTSTGIESSWAAGRTMLTYNINANRGDSREQGVIGAASVDIMPFSSLTDPVVLENPGPYRMGSGGIRGFENLNE